MTFGLHAQLPWRCSHRPPPQPNSIQPDPVSLHSLVSCLPHPFDCLSKHPCRSSRLGETEMVRVATMRGGSPRWGPAARTTRTRPSTLGSSLSGRNFSPPASILSWTKLRPTVVSKPSSPARPHFLTTSLLNLASPTNHSNKSLRSDPPARVPPFTSSSSSPR